MNKIKKLIYELHSFIILWLNPRQFNDKFCVNNMVISAARVRFKDLNAFNMFICALCHYKHICRSVKRQMEQKSNYACLRQLCCCLHCICPDSAAVWQTANMAFILFECTKRSYELNTATVSRCNYQSAYT